MARQVLLYDFSLTRLLISLMILWIEEPHSRAWGNLRNIKNNLLYLFGLAFSNNGGYGEK